MDNMDNIDMDGASKKREGERFWSEWRQGGQGGEDEQEQHLVQHGGG